MADAKSIGESMNDSGNDDFGDEADDGLSMVSTGFYPTQEETLGPLQRLQKYWDSDNVFNRQMVARNLLDTLRTIVVNQEELEEGLKVLVRLSEDIEPMVRSELMEQIPHLAMFCAENRKYFPNTIQEIILPTVVRYLTDGNNQVRKTSQAALLVLLEQELINHSDMVSQVCPVIIQLSSQDSSDDYRTEAVALMSKVSPLAGREITEGFFLPHFTVLCKDTHFHLRKVCAANIGDICNVVGQESTQAELLPRFEALCQDGVWGVRKACAECFMTVSYAVSSKVRKERLSPLFVQLLCDQSRWVRMAAFQNLGPFISTFADPSVSGVQLVYNPDGTVHIRMVDPEEGLHATSELTESNGPQNSLSKTDTFEIQKETSAMATTHRDNPVELSGNVHHSSTETAESSTSPSSHQHIQGHQPAAVKESSLSSHHHYSGLNEVRFMPSGHSPTPTVECTPPVEDTSPVENGVPSVEESTIRGSSVGTGSPEAEEFNSFQYWRNPVPVVSNKGDVDLDVNVISQSDGPGSPEDPGGQDKEETISSSSEHHTENIQEGTDGIDQQVRETDCQLNSQSNDPTTSAMDSQVITSAVFNLSRPKESLGESQDDSSGGKDLDSNGGDDGDSQSTVADGSNEGGLSVDPEGTDKATTVAVVAKEDGSPPRPPEDLALTLENIHLSDSQQSPDKGSSPDQCTSAGGSWPTVGETIDSHTSLQSAGVSMHRAEVNEAVDESETATNIGTMHVIGAQLDHKEELEYVNGWNQEDDEVGPQRAVHSDEENQPKAGLTKFQNVIPEQLLEQYLSMTDPTRAQTVDTEIAKHCAYSLPGVALTLGRHNWPCLKEVYDTLASDMQWKVRRTLAFSIHEMALILGDEITSLDLVPIFNGFLKDLDEVRIGVLKHFADFVKLLRPQLRQQYLNRMNDFLTTDNQRNWRFRLELAEQLIDMCDFYSPREVYDNILHIAIELACDRVADVRFMAYRLISRVLKIVGSSSEKGLVTGVKQQLHHKFAQSKKWFERQAYVHICQKFLEEQALDAEQFATDFLPSMLDLSTDPIPNVRITLARTLAQSVMPLVYFTTDDNPLHERLIAVLSQLANDEDTDVGYYSRLAPIGETTIPDEEPPV